MFSRFFLLVVPIDFDDVSVLVDLVRFVVAVFGNVACGAALNIILLLLRTVYSTYCTSHNCITLFYIVAEKCFMYFTTATIRRTTTFILSTCYMLLLNFVFVHSFRSFVRWRRDETKRKAKIVVNMRTKKFSRVLFDRTSFAHNGGFVTFIVFVITFIIIIIM